MLCTAGSKYTSGKCSAHDIRLGCGAVVDSGGVVHIYMTRVIVILNSVYKIRRRVPEGCCGGGRQGRREEKKIHINRTTSRL